MSIAKLILDALLVFLLVGTGGGKLRQVPSSLAIRDSLELSSRTWRAIGALEIFAVIGLIVGIWLPAFGLAASTGIAALMVGAIVVRARAGRQHPTGYVADVAVLLIALTTIVLHAEAL